MPQVNLSTASARELRQLLDSARGRGDAAQTYKILQEMAARREAGGRLKRRAGEPRVIDLDLGDPLEAAEDDIPPMPRWRPPAAGPATDMPPPALRIVEPDVAEAAAPDDLDLRLGPAEMPGARAARPPRARIGAGVVLGAALLFALGGGAGWYARDALSPPAAAGADPVEVAAVTPPPPVAPEPAAAPAVEPVPEALPDVLPLEVATEPQAAPAAPEPTALEPPPEPAEPAEAAPPAEACASAPTPADQAICGDPDLRRLQGDLREAYAKALAAHEERDLLRQRQLAWRDARSAVTDPARLTALYQQRIRKLDAATAEAQRRR